MLNTNSNKQTVKSRFLSGNNTKKHSKQFAGTISLFIIESFTCPTKVQRSWSVVGLFAILITQSSFLATAQTAPPKQWDARFGSSGGDWLYSLQQASDGGYILGGESYSEISGDKTQASQGMWDYWIVKTDADGVKQWDVTFGGSSNEYFTSLQQTSDGGYILGGASYSGIGGDKTQASQGNDDYWIVKTDADGVKQWDARFGGSESDFLTSLQQTDDGGYILGGVSVSGISGDKTQASQGYTDFWIVKTDANGVKQWDARFGGSYYDDLFSLQQTADGGYILGGASYSGISGDKTQASRGNHDYWIVKTNANGVKQWDVTFGGIGDDLLNSLQQATDGGYILGGLSASEISSDKTQASQGGLDYWIVKTDGNGVKQWDARFGGSSSDYLSSLQQTADGGYILGGFSDSGISGDKTEASQGASDYWIVKTDGNGVKQWDAKFGGSSTDQLSSLQQTTDGGYILGGFSVSEVSGDKTQASQGGDDYWIVKVASEFCSVPSNLSTTNITSSSAKLTWDAVAGAEGYKVRYKVAGMSAWTKKMTTGTSKAISGLSPNTTYKWEVQTFCETTPPHVKSVWSPMQEFTTPSSRMGDESLQQVSFQIYPNPAEDHATIQFTLPQSSHVSIKVYDVSGKEIAALLDADVEQGNHSLLLNTNQFSKGVYLVKMITDFGIQNQKLIVQ